MKETQTITTEEMEEQRKKNRYLLEGKCQDKELDKNFINLL